MNIRELILDILLEWQKGNAFCHTLLKDVLDKYDYLDARDKAFLKKVVQGTIEREIQMDYILNLFSSVPVAKMKPVIRMILRSSVYQLLYMDSVPDSAVCNEAVKLAQKRKFNNLKGFVNGVLRNIARNKDAIAYPKKEEAYEDYLSVRYSMPPFLVKHFLSHYEEQAETVLEAFLKSSPVCVRLKESLPAETVDELVRSWEENGVVVSQHPYLPYAKVLERADGIGSLRGYEEGFFTVQDVSSMLVAEVAGVKPGMQVMDVCASPGGKTTHVAEKAGAEGKVLSFDLTYNKTDRIRENAERLGFTNVMVKEQDATLYREDLREWADVLLADVPCSGLGVIGRKQDIKYRVDEAALEDIVPLQKQILTNVWRYVKPGGVLVYSTCTINPKENEEMVQWMEQELPLKKENVTSFLPKEVAGFVKDGMLQLLPGVNESDGFFIARLRRM